MPDLNKLIFAHCITAEIAGTTASVPASTGFGFSIPATPSAPSATAAGAGAGAAAAAPLTFGGG